MISSASAQMPMEYFLPAASPQGKLIRHGAYILQFDERRGQADWVIYELTDRRATGTLPISGTFRADPDVRTGAVAPDAYKGSGFERGQLVPPGDMRWSNSALAESFYMSVVSPMKPSFRKGLWAQIETLGRKWAATEGSVYIVAGPVLKGPMDTSGKAPVPAPQLFFRIFLDMQEPGIKGIGFLLPVDGREKDVMRYAVPIDSVEAATGIDFFPSLPDNFENAIEGTVDIPRWAAADSIPKASASATGTSRSMGKGFSPATLCKGKTSDGKRCVRMTTNPNGLCWEHQDQVVKPSTKK